MNNRDIPDPTDLVSQGKKNSAQVMNESGIDFIWGSDQDEFVEKQAEEPEEESLN
ncbi:hypothetical protein [Paenibacillus sp. GCM10023250]|uniref:hypothetical protein n=1 Tax=Paenibacillus sp. GCM10023250 TaxID=3252648 RepID=UPI0036062E78